MDTAIITLDIINEICHPDGKLARFSDRISNKKIIDRINSITDWGRKKDFLIIHVRVGFRPSYADASTRATLFIHAKKNRALAINEWGGQFCETLEVLPDDIQIIKHRVSAFYGTDLDLILRANDIKQLIFTGVSTNNAVELSAREAHDRDYQVTIVEDATECASDEEQAASIKALSRIATWRLTDELIQ
ncbi:isochorismatase family cysteine hydrolase [Simkania negevensis]|uniref:Isochorismatase-like domain-containing protein n=1 Tax=Simkania negevensis (strain ATCC VR-1471 / DSM 27360 / Z) TaxID=331113 RepID=F8L681_SIMNZ|nr:isochorismatase family cysteine hydrolase [Simkania negevensis]CCB88211.1 putative uncharacterized protein [Simkania negevensis Z]